MSSDLISQSQPVMAYASASTPRSKGPRVWAAVAVVSTGIGLVLLGGLFLIGILSMIVNFAFNERPMPPVSNDGRILMVVLYISAFGCFAAATAVLVAAVRGLLHIVRST